MKIVFSYIRSVISVFRKSVYYLFRIALRPRSTFRRLLQEERLLTYSLVALIVSRGLYVLVRVLWTGVYPPIIPRPWLTWLFFFGASAGLGWWVGSGLTHLFVVALRGQGPLQFTCGAVGFAFSLSLLLVATVEGFLTILFLAGAVSREWFVACVADRGYWYSPGILQLVAVVCSFVLAWIGIRVAHRTSWVRTVFAPMLGLPLAWFMLLLAEGVMWVLLYTGL